MRRLGSHNANLAILLESPSREHETSTYGSISRTLSKQSLGAASPPRIASDGSSLSSKIARQSSFQDLPPVALAGLGTRVSIAGTTAASFDDLERLFLDGDADIFGVEAVTLEGGWTRSLVLSAAAALLSALSFGVNNGNMNTQAGPMRAALGIPSALPSNCAGELAGPDFGANDALWGFCVSSFCLSALLGSAVAGSLADRYGRRAVLLPTSALYVVAALVEAASFLQTPLGRALVLGGFHADPMGHPEAWRLPHGHHCRPEAEAAALALLVGGRLLSGLACGITTVVVPMYLGEIAPAHLRGTLGSSFLLMTVSGMFVGQVLGLPALLGTAHGWPGVLCAAAVPAALQLGCLAPRLLESPRWLVMRSQTAAALRGLAALRGCDEDHEELEFELAAMASDALLGELHAESALPAEQLPAGPSAQRSLFAREPSSSSLGRASWPDLSEELLGADHGAGPGYAAQGLHQRLQQPLPSSASPRPPKGLCAAVRPACSPPGLICVTLMVAQQFSGINNAFNYSSSFLGRVGLSADTVSIVSLLINLGNVLVVLLSTVLMDRVGRRPLLLASSLGMAAAVGGLTAGLLTGSVPLVCVGVVSFVMAFGLGLGPVVWLLPAELFPMSQRAAGTAVVTSANWLANFAVGQSFPQLAAALGPLAFVPFGFVLLFAAAFTWALVPETRGKTLEQIAALYEPRQYQSWMVNA